MKLRTLLSAALLFVGGLALSGCFDTIAGPYDGPLQVGFSQEINGRSIGGYSATVGEGTGTVTLSIELIGPQRSSDTVFPVTLAEGSTATEGTHVSFPNGKTVTIPANSSFGTLSVNIPDGSLDAGATAAAVIEVMTSQDGAVIPAENWKQFTLTVAGQ